MPMIKVYSKSNYSELYFNNGVRYLSYIEEDFFYPKTAKLNEELNLTDGRYEAWINIENERVPIKNYSIGLKNEDDTYIITVKSAEVDIRYNKDLSIKEQYNWDSRQVVTFNEKGGIQSKYSYDDYFNFGLGSFNDILEQAEPSYGW